MSANDGGPAFPVQPMPDGRWISDGMSLRDWFAGQALAVLASDPNAYSVAYSMREKAEHIAKMSYSIADAILKERESER